MKIVNFENNAALFLWATNNFIELAEKTLSSKPFFDVALSGGKTAQAFFSYLKEHINDEEKKLFKHIRFFSSDERAVALESAESNAGNAWRQLLEPLALPPEHFFPMFDAHTTPEKAARLYEDKLQALLEKNADQVPVFDLIYLGIGEDGHTASLFPHSKLMENLAEDPSLVASTGEAINGYERLTFMPSLLLNAKNICVMATGANKASIIDDLLHAPLKPKQWPAQVVLRSDHPQLTLLTAF